MEWVVSGDFDGGWAMISLGGVVSFWAGRGMVGGRVADARESLVVGRRGVVVKERGIWRRGLNLGIVSSLIGL